MLAGMAPPPEPAPAPAPAPFIPVRTELKLKSETTPPTPPSQPVEKPPPPPRSAPPPAANIGVAPSVVPKRSATIAQTPRVESSSKKGVLIGGAEAVVVIGAVAAAYLSGALNRPPEDPMIAEPPRIEATMADYRSAYRNKNLAGVVKVFPALPADTKRSMQEAFGNCLVYEVMFANMQVKLDAANPTNAQVDVRSTHQCTPNSGGRQTNTSHHDVFSLKKVGDSWRIEGAEPVSAGGPQ